MPTTLTEKMPMTAMPRITSSERMRSGVVVAMRSPQVCYPAIAAHRRTRETRRSRLPISVETLSDARGDPRDRQPDADAMREELPGDRNELARRLVGVPAKRQRDPVHHQPQDEAIENAGDRPVPVQQQNPLRRQEIDRDHRDRKSVV